MTAAEHQANLDKLKFYRAEIMHEFGLLSGRVSTYVTSQSFLTIAYTSAMGNSNPRWGALFTLIFPCALALLGIMLSLRARDAIEAAVETITLWHAKQRQLFEADATMDAYRIQRTGADTPGALVDAVHRRSLAFSRLMPRIFLLAWCVFGLLAAWLHLRN